MRSIAGEIVLPPDAAAGTASAVLVEVRDVTVADAASTVVTSATLRDVALGPGARVRFMLDLPAVDPRRRLNLRAHVDIIGDGRVSGGDYLTTQAVAVPRAETAPPLIVPVTRV